MYSQWQEDEILIEFFKNQDGGFFVDVGAHDGIYFSNTYALGLVGWTGICIEAHPEYASRCRESRPESICISGACIGDDRDHVTFYIEPGGLFSGLSRDEGPAKRHYQASPGQQFGGFQAIEVWALTLNSALVDVTRIIDVISIDVEGGELDVLAGLDLAKYRPRVLLVEANSRLTARKTDIYLASRGYYLAGRTVVNYFYCARADQARLARAIRRAR